MWIGAEQDHLCTSPNEEIGTLAKNAPLTSEEAESTNYHPGGNINKEFFFEAAITNWITITVTGFFFRQVNLVLDNKYCPIAFRCRS